MDLPAPLEALFAAEQRRDWPALGKLLHPDVTWTIVTGRGSHTVRGRQAYLERLAAAYRDAPAATFSVHRTWLANDGLVATELVDDGGRVSLDVFALADGLVRHEWEHLLGVPHPAEP
ncbi:nuclear transport factor 2 family protein [Buchananella hordeovulneris]|uniref:SnoaL-like domain-containing protein n=1 Tax=Buchananella hordeovulneris TaxID=52770 RepID=A0A1Q5PTA2_9ACTO|nr:nuclear transport factor 2 family protein [Buchananella hordeovulneris]OKL50831.1 hypothetical protein BSZ40_10370 [Buchananella hordeovulneris]